MMIKPLPQRREGLRASVPFFLLDDEIDRLLSAIRTLAAEK